MKRIGSVIISASILFSPLHPAAAQEATEQSSSTQTPQTTEVKIPDAPIIDNNGLVFPRKDLDNFEMSTLGGDGLRENKKSSTFSRNAERKTNAEVNKPREKKEPEAETEAVDETPYEPVEDTVGASEDYYEPASVSSGGGQVGKIGKYFKWVDENGVLHVTDDLGTVPLKYQEQIQKEASEQR